jgi:hypothetical protein
LQLSVSISARRGEKLAIADLVRLEDGRDIDN